MDKGSGFPPPERIRDCLNDSNGHLLRSSSFRLFFVTFVTFVASFLYKYGKEYNERRYLFN